MIPSFRQDRQPCQPLRAPLPLEHSERISADNCRRFFFRAGVPFVSLHSRHFGSHAGSGKWTGSARLHDQDDTALAGAMARLSSDRGALEVPAILASSGAWLDSKLRSIPTSSRVLGRWYIRRYERALGPPHGPIRTSDIAHF